MDKVAIEFQEVHYAVGEVSILKNISGSIYEGKITTLVGPSGAGKTTLLKLCNGLISPTSGSIRILGERIEDYEPTQLRLTAGIALQNAPMIDGTVFDNLALPLTLQGETLSKNEALKYLESVGLKGEFLERKVDDLSGGQKQKVSIARTLVNRCEILLLDEITSSLDRQSVQEIEALIQKINAQYNVTIIWITHNLDQAKLIGHFTWIMIDGQVVETGPSEVLNNPANERVKQFVLGGTK